MKRLNVMVLGLLLLLSFVIFSRYVKRGGMKQLDFAVTIKVQERIDNSSRLRLARLMGETMEGATFLTSPMVSVLAVLGVTLMMFLKRKKWPLVAVLIPLTFGLMTLTEIYGKSVVHHPAPPFFLLKNPTSIFPKYYVWEDYSYPSGHTARASFLAIMFLSLIAYRLSHKKPVTIHGIGWSIVYVGLISLSRIYLGEHWLSDVIGGVLLGSGSGLLTSVPLLSYNKERHE